MPEVRKKSVKRTPGIHLPEYVWIFAPARTYTAVLERKSRLIAPKI